MRKKRLGKKKGDRRKDFGKSMSQGVGGAGGNSQPVDVAVGRLRWG